MLLNSAVVLCTTFCTLPTATAAACDGAQNIRLTKPVQIDARQRAEIQAMPPLKVVAVSAPPMARYDERQRIYDGIATDILCFIAHDLGISFEIPPGRDQTVVDKIRQVQEGRADLFIPLSYSAERAKLGLFTIPYYESHYAVIAKHGSRASVHTIEDLSRYRVGYVQGVSFEPLLKTLVPASQLVTYNQTSSDGLFNDVQNGVIDVAVFNKNVFIEKRYRQEFFDLEVLHTLHESPRAYRFYFSQSPENEQRAQVFDQYLAAIDISASIMEHEDGERHFLERYMAQQQQRTLLLSASVAAALLALFFYLALLRYRRLTNLLTERNSHIQQQRQALQEAYQKLETLSQTDGLTGLSNRRHFDQMLAYEYARYQRTGSPLSLLIIDVDHFKSVNDQYGHATGDYYLHTIARVLQRNIARSSDLVARYGGEEFTCLLTDTSADDAHVVAERIVADVAALGLPNAAATPPHLTLSIGIATIMGSDPGAQGLFE
ncbi:MAG: GGDEF domain-containing protein, partial [Burkholderiaceae bacterium]